jgi:hypothetical protein
LSLWVFFCKTSLAKFTEVFFIQVFINVGHNFGGLNFEVSFWQWTKKTFKRKQSLDWSLFPVSLAFQVDVIIKRSMNYAKAYFIFCSCFSKTRWKRHLLFKYENTNCCFLIWKICSETYDS